MLRCNSKKGHDDLTRLKSDILALTSPIPERLAFDWFYRFWSLQIRQYEYWLRGYISSDLFVYWMKNRRADCAEHDKPADPLLKGPFGEKKKLNSWTHLHGWIKVRASGRIKHHPFRFEVFMDNVFKAKDDATLDAYIRRSRRQLFGPRAYLVRALFRIQAFLYSREQNIETRYFLSPLDSKDIDQVRAHDYDRAVKANTTVATGNSDTPAADTP